MINLIAAFSHGQVLGYHQTIPWHLPNDFAWFKQQTLNHPIIMGRKTFDSIGRILPKRDNIVITTQSLVSDHPQLHFVHCLDDALVLAQNLNPTKDCFIIGGAQIYTQALPLADRLYLTFVDADLKGDVFFPDYDPTQWRILFQKNHAQDAKHAYAYQFNILEKI